MVIAGLGESGAASANLPGRTQMEQPSGNTHLRRYMFSRTHRGNLILPKPRICQYSRLVQDVNHTTTGLVI